MLPRPRVAVIGLGVSGIVAVKNLREVGFDAIGFDRNKYVGGLWVFTEDKTKTSVLRTTQMNNTKQFSCYHDYPFPDKCPDYPTGEEVAEYVDAYAKHNDLFPHLRLGTPIRRIERQGDQWMVNTENESEAFDRVLVATGPFSKPQWPDIPGKFGGQIIHGQAYKGWKEFEGKRVAVIGIGSTGADTAVDLAGHATVYLSHRGGARVMRRYQDGKPGDHMISRRRMQTATTIGSLHPSLAQKGSAMILDHLMRKSWPELDPAWKLLPAPPAINSPGGINDELIPRLADGSIKNASGVERFTETGVVFKDEGEIPIDVVIYCTGFTFSYDILAPEADPCKTAPSPEWDAKSNHNGLKFPYLYMTHFHLDYPDSLAFVGPMGGPSFAGISNGDLSTQAIAQVWAGNFDLPDREEMMKWCEKIYRLNLQLLKTGRIIKPNAVPGELEPWLNAAAGNGLNEATGWGWEGWKFQARDRELHSLVKDGIFSPHIYRLLDGRLGGRKKWDGARAEILKVNGR